MADVEGGICFALVGALQQYFNTTQWGMDCKCWDSCCRCACCWDEGEFVPDDQPGAISQQQQESGPKSNPSVERGTENGDEDLPAYKPSEQMSVPAAPSTTAATTAGGQTGIA